jgi:hypothetical protein
LWPGTNGKGFLPGVGLLIFDDRLSGLGKNYTTQFPEKDFPASDTKSLIYDEKHVRAKYYKHVMVTSKMSQREPMHCIATALPLPEIEHETIPGTNKGDSLYGISLTLGSTDKYKTTQKKKDLILKDNKIADIVPSAAKIAKVEEPKEDELVSVFFHAPSDQLVETALKDYCFTHILDLYARPAWAHAVLKSVKMEDGRSTRAFVGISADIRKRSPAYTH